MFSCLLSKLRSDGLEIQIDDPSWEGHFEPTSLDVALIHKFHRSNATRFARAFERKRIQLVPSTRCIFANVLVVFVRPVVSKNGSSGTS